MRIGLFHWSLPQPGRKPGGVDMVVHQLANALTKLGESVCVLSLLPPPSDALYKHRQIAPAFNGMYENSLLRIAVLPFLLNTIGLDQGLDVLHIHGDDWFFFNRKCASVRTMHGSALNESRTATSFKRRMSQGLIYYLEILSARLATLTLGVGPETVALYDAYSLVDNGVSLTTFHPGPKAETPTILFVGTWAGRKRGDFIYRQFIDVIQHSVPNAELIMVCDQVVPAAAGVKQVLLPTNEMLAGLYRSAWVFAYPSLYEGFGMTYLESLASGTAVVASPNEGAAETGNSE